VVIAGDGAGPVAHVRLQLHERAIAGLLQRLQLDPPARGLRCPGQVALPRACCAEQIAQLSAVPLELRPGFKHPVVVHAGQKLASVLRGGPVAMGDDLIAIVGRRRSQGSLALGLEDPQVDAARLPVAPAQVPGRHDQRRLACQDLTQVMQFAAKVGQCLGVRRLRPERAGDPQPGLTGLRVEHQIGEQSYRARRAQPSACHVVRDCLFSQYGHVQHLSAPSWYIWLPDGRHPAAHASPCTSQISPPVWSPHMERVQTAWRAAACAGRSG
jgi:hypothetical protein